MNRSATITASIRACIAAGRHGLTAAAAAGLLLGATACNELEKIDDGGSTAEGIPDEVQRVFDDSCNIAGCHDSNSAQGGLDLTATAAPGIIGGASTQSSLPLVELGNVQGSYLAIKLLAESELRQGDRMPLGRDFGDATVALDNAIILGWIAGADLPGGGGGGDADTTDDGDPPDSAESTAAEIRMCGISDVAPSAADPFVSGDAEGDLPPEIGAALANNCGCHGPMPSEFIEGVPSYVGTTNFATVAEFNGTTSNKRIVHEVVLERLQSTGFSRMPPTYCVLEDGEPITSADLTLLVSWLEAGAPDAPTWAGM